MTTSFAQLLLLVTIHSFCSSSMAAKNNATDYEALLSIESKITDDPFQVFTSWNDSVHFCQWEGITCGRRHVRVTAIDLSSKALSGSVSPYIGNLTFLTQISLYNNSFHGHLPPEIHALFRLRIMELSNNSFTGPLPSNLSHCSNLRILNVAFNRIHGRIPPTIGNLFNLQSLSISTNQLHGRIPPSIGNLSSIQLISAAYNSLEGRIPDSFGRLKSLTAIGFGGNNLSGVIPPSVYNLSSITIFSLGDNSRLQGYLPSNLGLLFPHLKYLDVSGNEFVGEIPVSLSNASQLEILFLGNNSFTGPTPPNFGALVKLSELYLSFNNLGTGGPNDTEFFASLANCTRLKGLQVHSNRFGGSLPVEIANYSTHIDIINTAQNQLSGTIPSGISNLINLVLLDMDSNQLTGSVPTSIGRLQHLQALALYSNQLTGEIPSSVGNNTWLTRIYLDHNRFQGTIPRTLQNCTNLLELDLSVNNLNGSVPKEVFDIPSLSIVLNLSHNHFTGSLPSPGDNMKTLGVLDVSWNRLSGQIPASFGSCASLEWLIMSHNSFEGSIPSSFSSLLGIQFLDLSVNNLTGPIPAYLERFKLLYLNLSFNSFEGEVPTKGVFKNYSTVSVAGNTRLCGGIPELLLPKCPVRKTNNKTLPSLRLSAIIVGSCLFVGLILLFLWFRKKRSDNVSAVPLIEGHPIVSYEQILRATDAFSPSNLIGVGSFGSVYKGTIHEIGQAAAIKVLDLQRRGASRSFTAECEALRNIRHRNLVRIITSCSSTDFQGNDFKALVYEYMPNGSLERWLHPPPHETNEANRSLNLAGRLNIAIDVARAVDYLHHGCQEPIIHCDLKPSNVLLDDEMTGRVGDFGLARILGENVANQNESSSIGVKGTIGYAAPEYGLGGEVSREGDVYSFGILLLEMITGKRPTDRIFKNELNLHKFAMKAASDGNVLEIADPLIVRDHENEVMRNRQRLSQINGGRIEECVSKMIEIGLACSTDSPTDRLEMSFVVQKLSKVKDAFPRI